jgi:hypothetical protein
MTISTFFGLLAEFGTVEVPLETVAEKYFGLSIDKAKARAQVHKLPIPAHRCGTQKSQWLVNLQDLARHIDAQRDAARAEWEKMNERKAS